MIWIKVCWQLCKIRYFRGKRMALVLLMKKELDHPSGTVVIWTLFLTGEGKEVIVSIFCGLNNLCHRWNHPQGVVKQLSESVFNVSTVFWTVSCKHTIEEPYVFAMETAQRKSFAKCAAWEKQEHSQILVNFQNKVRKTVDLRVPGMTIHTSNAVVYINPYC